MKSFQLIFLLFLSLPFLSIWLPVHLFVLPKNISSISAVSIIRIFLLLILGKFFDAPVDFLQLSGVLVSGYPLEFVLQLNMPRLCFLLVAELVYILAHWISRDYAQNQKIIIPLLFLAQGMLALFVTAENIVAAGGLLFLSGAILFYLVRFSLSHEDTVLTEQISRSIYMLFFVIGALIVTWALAEFGDKELRFARGAGSIFGLITWMLILLLSVPSNIWSKWFNLSIEHLPEGVTLAIVTFLSGLNLKMATVFGSVYSDLEWKFRIVFYALGILGCIFSMSELFFSSTRRKMLGGLPGFFLSTILVSVGVSQGSVVHSVYYVCIFVPVFTALILYASVMVGGSRLEKIFIASLFALVLGFPGTPVYLIFTTIGARSIDMGESYTIVFALLWFLYFCANIQICRRVFLDKSQELVIINSPLANAPAAVTGYGLFLMFFIIIITHFAGGLL